ncbi:hypothetical protein SAMD00023353_7700340 [Rosellinia necatrix]|uniref:DUF7492 domain-containing protein n=1 Tax=Rosellinia necatrix TaxID=77044 RepID=A0A1W2TU70_ROSNE|nr:hypothetical protein SAMD00023353_7700340 [Rosellinia necatrix]
MSFKNVAVAAVSLLAAVPTAKAHTWVESLYRIDSTGTFTGPQGYPIGFIPRSQGVSDDVHQNKILDTSTNPAICKPLSSGDSTTYPPLKAAAGDYIAMLYQENGHVTQPDQTPRPYRGGNVYVYGTKNHQDTDGINDVLNSWTPDGKGGNQKGKLIATHYFDDDRCFQNAPGNAIAEERKAKYGVDELFCQTDIQLPTDLPSDGTYTLMWVWDWPRIISDTQNVTEIYTSCAQIDLSGSVKGEAANGPSINFGNHDNIASAAISSQVHNLIEATALGIGTNSPPAPTGLVEITSSSNPSTSSSRRHGNGEGQIKTVTVTAEPATLTQYYTVTMGTEDSNGGDATPPPSTPTLATSTSTSVFAITTATASTRPTVTSSVIPFPTSFVPVTSVRGFLKVRAARVTGHARRDSFRRW